MAKFESLGYCPNNKFMTYRSESPVVKVVRTILGRRPVYMVYDQKDVFWSEKKRDSIVDALYGGDGILGVQVATYLELILPEPLEDQNGESRMIIIHDVINPAQIDGDILSFDNGREWEFTTPEGDVNRRLKPSSKGTKESTLKLFFDTRYLVVVQDFGAPRPVHIYLLELDLEANEVQIHGAPLNGEAMDDELPSFIQVGS